VNTTAPFRLRRVLLGVVVGLALCGLAFYGWVRYRTSQYHDREASVLSRYQYSYDVCLHTGDPQVLCRDRVYRACAADAFWRVHEPFTIGLGAGLSEAALRCRDGASG
jgi:hypothetical protein